MSCPALGGGKLLKEKKRKADVRAVQEGREEEGFHLLPTAVNHSSTLQSSLHNQREMVFGSYSPFPLFMFNVA